MTKLEPTLTSLRKLAENHISFGQYKAAQMLQDAADVIEGLESENASLRCAVEGFCDQNTKLRELAGYMIRCMQEHHNCVDCLVNGEQCDISCIESDLLELGIEVGE